MSANKLASASVGLLSVFAFQGALAANNTPTTKPAISDYTRPLSFESNRGQTDRQVDFLAHGAGVRLFLSHAEAVMALDRGVAVRMRPVGGMPTAAADPLEQQPSQSNYFIGNLPEKWHTKIPNYAKVRYRNVYPGIDLIYYGNQRQLEYDFFVTPGANPDKILLDFKGANQPTLDASGDLVMRTEAGELRWHKPVAYQEVNGTRKLVACDYVRKSGSELSFAIGAYDRSKPLIIDPVLVYSTYLGGSSVDSGQGIAVDANGNAYVTGYTSSADFPTMNAFQNSFAGFPGITNAFVAKFDSTGKRVYSTYLGGSGFSGTGDIGNGIAVDAHGNAYVTGITGSPDFPTRDAFQSSLGGTCQPPCFPTNAFVAKLSAAGNTLVYSTFLGGQNDFQPQDSGNAITVDAYGNAYVTGSTTSTDFPTKNAFQKDLKSGCPVFPGSSMCGGNAFVTKFDASGTALVYSTYLGGSGYTVDRGGDSGNAIAVDAHGNAYITGTTVSSDFPIKNAFQKDLRSGANAFVTKFDRDGDSLVYSTYLGGSGTVYTCAFFSCPFARDSGSGIAVDAHGNAYITGTTVSSDFPIKNAFQPELKSAFGNAFVTKLDRDGDSLVYSTFLGGSGNTSEVAGDLGNAIALDEHGQVYVTGRTVSTDFPIKNAFQPQFGGGAADAFVTEIDAAGCALIYSSYLGGSGSSLDFPGGDAGNGIAVDSGGNAYITGATNSTDFPTKNAFQDMLKGSFNAFVTKISAK